MMEPGTRLGPYKIISRIGAGGMGEVFRAKDVRLDRDVAIKVLPAHMMENPEAIVRFEREAKAVAALSHPNILAIHDFDQDHNQYYAVTELLEGETLRARITRSPIPWRKTAEIGIAIAKGLAAAHARGIIHRDLKPENIFLTNEGLVKILDFGLAAVRAKPIHTGLPESATESRDTEEAVMGTVGYMSPEQVRGSAADARSDLFAFGCVLYEMVTGNRAFGGQTIYDVVAAVLREEPRDLEQSQRRVPPELQRLIHHCLEKNAEERSQAAHDLAFELKTILSTTHSNTGMQWDAVEKTRSIAPTVLLSFLLLIAIAAGLFFFLRQKNVHSIAILPFVNQGNPENEYLSDGIPETIIMELAQIKDLRVMAPSTVFRYRGVKKDVAQIGKELNVEVVLTGTLEQKEDLVAVKAELIRISDGSLLWGENYTTRTSRLISFQEDIATEILKNLELKLTGEERQQIARPKTSNVEAFQLYLKGLHFSNKRTAESLEKGIRYFYQAIEKDPVYAPAYAGLAFSYGLQGGYDVLPPQEVFPKAKAAALKALLIDEESAEAHTTLGQVYTYYWDFQNAEREFRRAIQLKPGFAIAHSWYSTYLIAVGKLEDALSQNALALELDPLSVSVRSARVWRLVLLHRYPEAIQAAQDAFELDPDFAPAHTSAGTAYLMQGKYLQAIAEHQRAYTETGSMDALAELGHAYAVSGNSAEAIKILEQLTAQSAKQYVSPIEFAMIYAGLNRKEEAFSWLQKAFEQHAEYLPFINTDPRFEPLRSDPRFEKLLNSIETQS